MKKGRTKTKRTLCPKKKKKTFLKITLEISNMVTGWSNRMTRCSNKVEFE